MSDIHVWYEAIITSEDTSVPMTIPIGTINTGVVSRAVAAGGGGRGGGGGGGAYAPGRRSRGGRRQDVILKKILSCLTKKN